MGVLDDAIRQHLELKRQRGADPTEVKREEDEALGEVVRPKRAAATQEEPPPADADPIVHQETAAFDPVELAEALGQMPVDEVGEAPVEPVSEPVAEPQHEEEIEPDPIEPDEGPSPATEEPVAEEASDEEEADELEQTPDFLEDAPEHDKLWFEQKPPKDFDF